VTDADYTRAAAIVTDAGLLHERSGECLWCWRPDGGGGRYVDVRGLLAAKDGKAYALGCYTGPWSGSTRPERGAEAQQVAADVRQGSAAAAGRARC
jgi:hypothetical protein